MMSMRIGKIDNMEMELDFGSNNTVLSEVIERGIKVDLIYADPIYSDLDFESWIPQCHQLLKDTGSMFVQTDQRSVAELKLYLDKIFGKDNFVNWIIWSYNWGGRGKRSFAKKHDDILFYSKTKDYKFYPDRVMIPKKTAKTKLNKSGNSEQIPTDVWSSLDGIGNFHTMSKERVKGEDGKNLHWQKPLALMERVILPTTDEGDLVLDPFMGTGSTAMSCIKNGRDFIGIENDEKVFNLAKLRLETYKNILDETFGG